MGNQFNLFVVDDNKQEIQNCKDSIDVYSDIHKDRVVVLTCSETLEDALKKISKDFDGAIIDMKLDGDNEGNDIINKLINNNVRIPIVIHTGTPDAIHVNEEIKHITVIKKGDKGYRDILDDFYDIHNSGMTKIVSGKGILEEKINDVFFKNLLPQKEVWVEYGKKDNIKTEKALLRYTLNHLLELLDNDDDFYPEETFLYPIYHHEFKTGSILTSISSPDKFGVILTPSCDLVVRENGQIKTDRILVAEIDTGDSLFSRTLPRLDDDSKRAEKLSEMLRNAYSNYYHWLPKTKYFCGGFINFRKISTFSKRELHKSYTKEVLCQISSGFIKDVLSRFSTYYSRQGQPNIFSDDISKFIIDNIKKD